MLEIHDVRYRAGRSLILDGVSAALSPGRFHVILGPNGAGKSTLLKVATGLLRPLSGEVRYGGTPLAAIAPEALARTRAVLSQHVELAFPVPAREVVLMGRYPHYGRVPTRRDQEIVDRALALVGMEERHAQPYPTLSGGEQQKVQLARVLAQIWPYDGPPVPRYLFLDEPTSSLDVHFQLHLLDVARGLLEHHCTVVAVLHDLNTAFHYGDHFLLMEAGRLVLHADGAETVPGDLLERVFRVRAHRVADPETGERLWRFSL